MTKQDAKNSINLTDEELEQPTPFSDEEIEQMIHEEQQAYFEQIDIEDYSEPYAEYGEEYEEEPLFEKTNRQKGVRKVRD